MWAGVVPPERHAVGGGPECCWRSQQVAGTRIAPCRTLSKKVVVADALRRAEWQSTPRIDRTGWRGRPAAACSTTPAATHPRGEPSGSRQRFCQPATGGGPTCLSRAAAARHRHRRPHLGFLPSGPADPRAATGTRGRAAAGLWAAEAATEVGGAAARWRHLFILRASTPNPVLVKACSALSCASAGARPADNRLRSCRAPPMERFGLFRRCSPRGRGC